MAHKKAGGSTKNGRDSNPKYLGIKLTPGDFARVGAVLVRQRGSEILPGRNVGIGKDHTLFALKDGKIEMGRKRKIHFDNSVVIKKIMHIV
jgi:large subunit ribosomal protein L27